MADPPASIAATLAALAVRSRAHAVPAEVAAAATRAFVDTIGVLMAGRIEPPVAILAATLGGSGGGGSGDEAVSLAGRRRYRAEDAALLDGLAAHMLDYDDVAAHGHPSTVIVPALLAAGQRIGASGQDLLGAYAVGYEAWAMLARCEPDAYHLGSWHPTSLLGIVAATTALAALAGLDEAAARHALGLAASFAGGVIASFGTPAKPLQAGRAAAGAIQAVRLARAGFTAGPDAIDGPHGLLRGISPGGRVDPALAVPATGWRLLDEGLSVKRYPVCYAAHRAIDGVLALAAAARLRADEVRAVTVSLGRAPEATLRYRHPQSGGEARFSVQHNVAAALLDGAVGFAQLTDGYVLRPDVAACYGLTATEIVDDACPDQPGLARCDRVRIATHDGRVLDSGPIRYPRGHARHPLSDAELAAKFLDCARHGGVDEPDRLLAAVQGLGKAGDVREAGLW